MNEGARHSRLSSPRWVLGLFVLFGICLGLITVADLRDSTSLRWVVSLLVVAVISTLLVVAATRSQSQRWVVALTICLAATSALVLCTVLLSVMGLGPGRNIGDRIWSQPFLGVYGGAAAVISIAGGFLVAARTRQGRIRPGFAVALSVILAVVGMLGSRTLLHSTTSVSTPSVQLSPPD